jgi:hypothetical protein
MAKDNKKEVKEKEDWMQKKWRPMMAIMYMTVCVFDFILFPIMFTVVQFWEVESVNDAFRQWQPLTLIGAGLFHMAMGAVLGITAWSRGQEKIAGAAVNTQQGIQAQDTLQLPAPVSAPVATPIARPKVEQSGEVKVGYGGKLAPPEASQPLI